MDFELFMQKRCDENEVIRFLNLSAKDFFFGNNKYLDKSFDVVLKSAFLSGITDVERTIRGAFDCDLGFANVDVDLLTKMFPNVAKMFNVVDSDDLSILSQFLTLFRNINAHAFASKSDLDFFEIDYSFLLNQIAFDCRIKYYNNGITVAGIIFLLLNFLRKESIANLCKRSFIFGMISKGKYEMDDGEQFATRISHVNLEVPIRQDNADTLFDAMIGSYRKNAVISEDCFEVTIGLANYPTYKISGSLIGNLLKINSGSLTKTYYKEEYCLKIVDEKSFIELSNQLPPFVLVDFLYKIDTSVFDCSTVDFIKDRYKFISKLNKPKFYVDKNLSVLLMPDSISDFRVLSSVCRDSISAMLMSIENFIYRTRKIKRGQNYSSIGAALECLNISDEVHKSVKYLRNFVAHGYLLDEYMLYKSEQKQFTLRFIIKTLKTLLDACESHTDVYFNVLFNIKNYLINTLVKTKYKKIIEFSRNAIREYPNFDTNEFSKKIGFVNNSMFDICDFNCLITPEEKVNRVIRLSIQDFNGRFYLNNNEVDVELINGFCSRHGYQIKSIKNNGLLTDYDLQLC